VGKSFTPIPCEGVLLSERATELLKLVVSLY
jgi:hypothetical protein